MAVMNLYQYIFFLLLFPFFFFVLMAWLYEYEFIYIYIYISSSILLGASSLSVVTIYPLMKRFTHWPQAVLGACLLIIRGGILNVF